MILKNSLIVLFNFIWLNSVSGASFSKVFVKSGAEVVPVEYVKYGAPPISVASSQLAHISAAPVGSVVPLSSAPNYLPPCGTPCVYPGSSVAATQPAAPNYVTYKSSVPVVVASRDDPNGYEYSYIVYDENTGDRKSQREHSDGSVVRGEYSLIQPDGYVREVQYVADDLTGFNAIVKNFLPANIEKKVDHKDKSHGPPCHEAKKGPIKHADHENKSSEENQEKSSEESHEKSSEESNEKSSKEHNAHASHSNEHNHAEKSSEKHSYEKPSAALIAHESHKSKSEEESNESKSTHEAHAEPVSSEESREEVTHGEHQAQHSSESKESHEEHKQDSHEQKESHESHEEPSHDVHNESHEGHAEPAHEGRSDNHESEGNVLVSYNDIIKCVQSAMRKSNGVASPHQVESPLTYIILNKPC